VAERGQYRSAEWARVNNRGPWEFGVPLPRQKARRRTTKAQRAQCFKEKGKRCVTCGRKRVPSPFQIEVDHIIPVSKGGTNAQSNLQPMCGQCNRKKGNR
jgi:5-methylcytosine-specific restriction endonuclease McrA